MRFLILQHARIEHPGSFRPLMAQAGHMAHTVELDEGEPIPPLENFDAMLVMGGPMDVWQEAEHPWLIAEKAAIRDWVGAGRPYLGLCLGAQLLAEACGGAVALMSGPPEVGIDAVRIEPDPIFAGLGTSCPCFQWHGAEVTQLPQGARLIATSDGCRVQGFALGGNAYGLQFHLELTATTAAEWGALPEYAAALETLRGPGALGALEAEVATHLPRLQDAAAVVFGNFLHIAARTPAPV